MQLDIQTLLDGFEAPAIFYRENTVRYFNQGARVLFSDLREGKGLPERMREEDFPFRAEVIPTGRGELYLFRPRLEERAVGDLAAVSQELRLCLAGLTLALEEMRPAVSAAGGGESMLNTASHSLYRLRRLADHSDLLRQLESRSLGVYRERAVDLAGLCRDLGEHAAALSAQIGIRLRLEITEPALPTWGDEELLRRAVLNLLSNAIKAARSEVGLRLERTDRHAKITVWDDGAGMESRRMMAVFQPQTRRRLSRPEDGAGLGLRLVRETAVLHGGVALAVPEPGGGVRVTLSVALRPAGSTLAAPVAWGEDGFDLVLTELSDALPARLYHADELEGL